MPFIKLEDVQNVYNELAKLELTSAKYYDITNVVACPGRSTCNLSVTSSKGLAQAIMDGFEEEPDSTLKAEAGQINISGCHNGCGQHALGTIGF